MLPDSTKIRQNQNKLKFADTGIQALVEELEKQGLSRKNMIAKIAGGAKMFQFSSDTAMGNIGEKRGSRAGSPEAVWNQNRVGGCWIKLWTYHCI